MLDLNTWLLVLLIAAGCATTAGAIAVLYDTEKMTMRRRLITGSIITVGVGAYVWGFITNAQTYPETFLLSQYDKESGTYTTNGSGYFAVQLFTLWVSGSIGVAIGLFVGSRR